MPPAEALSELIGMIYEAASDSAQWPRLLDCLADYLGQAHASARLPPAAVDEFVSEWSQTGWPKRLPVSDGERAMLSSLAPHFLRAQQIHKLLAEQEEERNLLERLMDRLPLGFAIIDDHGLVVSLNRSMLSICRSGTGLKIEAGRILSEPSAVLGETLQTLFDSGEEQLLRLEHRAGEPLSLWLYHAESSRDRHRRVMMLAACGGSRALSEKGLIALYGLTPAEARLTQHLALGRTLDECCAELGISANTGKSHLKKVFAKTGVKRQTELIQAIYGSPLWLRGQDEPAAQNGQSRQAPWIDALRDDDGLGIRLPDGRRLAYSDKGNPAGVPILFMHGLAGSRHLHPPEESILHELGIRLIIPERPGSGDSDPQVPRTLQDWPRDIRALADHLQLSAFSVLGYSSGTPYALICGSELSSRVNALSIAAAMPPLDHLEELQDYSRTFRLSLLVARHTPSLLPPMIRMMVKGIRNHVYRYIDESLRDAPDPDRSIFDDPRLRIAYAQGLLAGVKRGEEDLTREILLAAHDWGFSPEACTTPCTVWHGEADPLINIRAAERLAERMPNACLNRVKGSGHYVLYTHWSEILKELRDRHACRLQGLMPAVR